MRKRIKVRAKEILIKETTTETRNEMRGDPIESQRSLMQDSSKKVWHACTISSIVAFAIVSFIIICSVLYSYLTYLAYALIYSLVITYPPSCIDSYQHCYSYLHKLLCTFPFHITLISHPPCHFAYYRVGADGVQEHRGPREGSREGPRDRDSKPSMKRARGWGEECVLDIICLRFSPRWVPSWSPFSPFFWPWACTPRGFQASTTIPTTPP